MKIITGHFGECRFVDCMHPEDGMPALMNAQFNLGLTDPPYNLNFHGSSHTRTMGDKKIFYVDNRPATEYYAWCWHWFETLQRITRSQLFTPGLANWKEWILQNPHLDMVIWYNKRAQGGSKTAFFRKWEPILCDLSNQDQMHRLKWSIIELQTGVNQFSYTEYIHPCPKPSNLWKRILKEIRPESVIDPFLGSGTTAEVCEELGIPWLGYENMEAYAPDIQKRIDRGIQRHSQTSLSKYVVGK